jgi:hypothetical protein
MISKKAPEHADALMHELTKAKTKTAQDHIKQQIEHISAKLLMNKIPPG